MRSALSEGAAHTQRLENGPMRSGAHAQCAQRSRRRHFVSLKQKMKQKKKKKKLNFTKTLKKKKN